METKEIQELLQAYVQYGSESAFRELVQRYVTLVYSTALRQTGGRAHLAEDVAQTVFTDLARKARNLPPDVLLGGWLHNHTCFVVANVLRADRRRADRENQAAQMNAYDSDETWKKLAPVLDDAINDLAPEDRDAVTLRYFEQRDFRSIGATLGVSDDTAQKRVSRAVDKLRDSLVKQGFTLSASALATLLADQALATLPANLAENIAGTALSRTPETAGTLKSLISLKMGLAFLALIGLIAITPSIVSRMVKNSPVAPAEENLPIIAASESLPTDPATPTQEILPQMAANSFGSATSVRPANASNVLTLTVLSANSQRPIPNATIEFRAQAEKWVTKKLTADRSGICKVDLLPDLKTLQLTTQIKGFADTRLSWNVTRGEAIPAKYTLALERAVLIGGRVLDADGNPVEGAKVGFGYDDNPILKKFPESHEFGWVEVKTDSEGRWQIDRIAADMLKRLFGYAQHTNYLDAPALMVSQSSEAEEQLRNREHVYRLGNGTAIHGVVIDPDRQPINEAKILVGRRDFANRRETQTLSDGSFSLAGCIPGKDILTAEAPGFAATTVEIDSSTNVGPYELQLQRGKTLRLRVVDKLGGPVSQATVGLHSNSGRNPDGAKPRPVEAIFYSKTDDDGRLVWDSAPDGELQFYISKPGYMNLEHLELPADNVEHIVTMLPALVVRGSVRSEDGQPIPRFKIICGWFERSFKFGSRKEIWNTTWSGFERDWLSFSGGNYLHSFQQASPAGTRNPGYLLRFEADGCAAFVTRLIGPDEGEVQIDVVLRRAIMPVVSVLLPNGIPAVGADVGLVSPGSKLNLNPGGFARGNLHNGTSLLVTDDKGQFRLPADEAISRIIIAHPNGYADTTRQRLYESPKISLQPWGVLQGTYLSDGKPLVGRRLAIRFEKGKHDDFTFDPNSSVSSDANGHFVFSKLPAGTHKLIALIPTLSFGIPGVSQDVPLQDVTIRSGETTTVNIGGAGYKIIVHIRFSGEINRELGERVMASIHPPAPALPQELLNDAETLKPGRQPSEISKSSRTQRYPLIEESNGVWTAENVLPGNYEITALLFPFTKTAEGKSGNAKRGKLMVTVPEIPATGMIDVGEIELKATPAK